MFIIVVDEFMHCTSLALDRFCSCPNASQMIMNNMDENNQYQSTTKQTRLDLQHSDYMPHNSTPVNIDQSVVLTQVEALWYLRRCNFLHRQRTTCDINWNRWNGSGVLCPGEPVLNARQTHTCHATWLILIRRRWIDVMIFAATRYSNIRNKRFWHELIRCNRRYLECGTGHPADMLYAILNISHSFIKYKL